jgi:hypothetical protein
MLVLNVAIGLLLHSGWSSGAAFFFWLLFRPMSAHFDHPQLCLLPLPRTGAAAGMFHFGEC